MSNAASRDAPPGSYAANHADGTLTWSRRGMSSVPGQDFRAAVFDQAAVGIAVSSLDGRILEINRKFADLLGYAPDELRGRTILDITHPVDSQVSGEAMQQLAERRMSALTFEKRYIRKDGTDLWSWATATLLEGAEGEPPRFLGVIEDIGARKRVENALLDETRILELLNRTARTLG